MVNSCRRFERVQCLQLQGYAVQEENLFDPKYEDTILRNVSNFYHSVWDRTVEYLNLRQYRNGNFRLPGC